MYEFYNYDLLPEYQMEILIDLLFTGDLSENTIDYVFEFTKRSVHSSNPKIFDIHVVDTYYWKRHGVPDDRTKWRSIFVKEW